MKNKMESITNNIVPIFVFFAIIVVIFLNLRFIGVQSSNDCILLITFLALVWYSYETSRARISSEKQTGLSFTPFVVLKLEENEAAGYCFKLRNEGVGLALYIRIAENNIACRNSLYPVTEVQQVKAPEFEIPYSLYPGQEEILKPRQKGEKNIWIIKKSGTIKITYKNFKGEDFSGRFEIKERCKDEKGWTYWEVQPKD
jgi:hypothetical protein